MNWCFAKVNNRLAEIYFERKGNKIRFHGHAYVNRSDLRTKKEGKCIDKDVSKYNFVYRNRGYRDKNSGEIFEFSKID